MKTIRETYGMKAVSTFKLKPTVSTTYPGLIMGTELEIEGLDEATAWHDMVAKLGFRVENDGSLRGANNSNGNGDMRGLGLEFISKPMESDVLATAVHEFFKTTKINADNYSDRCSVHVHVNCQDLKWVDVACIALLYSVVEDCLFHFIGHDRSNNIFCIPWSQCRISYDLISKLAAQSTPTPHAWQKYTALNLQPLESYGTVEFRHMEGTHDPERITQWLNIIGAMFKYCASTDLASLIKEVTAMNTVSDYHGFFDRVFQGNLVYNNEYEQMLEAGVINAKLSAMNYGKEPKRKENAEVVINPAPAVNWGGMAQRGTATRRMPVRPIAQAYANAQPMTADEFQATLNRYNQMYQADLAGQGAVPGGAVPPPVDDLELDLPVGDAPVLVENRFQRDQMNTFSPNTHAPLDRYRSSRDNGNRDSWETWAAMWRDWCDLEYAISIVRDMSGELYQRQLGEHNGDFYDRVMIRKNHLMAERDRRVVEYRQATPRLAGEDFMSHTIRTVRESDVAHYAEIHGITTEQALAITRNNNHTWAHHCYLVATRLEQDDREVIGD